MIVMRRQMRRSEEPSEDEQLGTEAVRLVSWYPSGDTRRVESRKQSVRLAFAVEVRLEHGDHNDEADA
jgi:hypothetical protein